LIVLNIKSKVKLLCAAVSDEGNGGHAREGQRHKPSLDPIAAVVGVSQDFAEIINQFQRR